MLRPFEVSGVNIGHVGLERETNISEEEECEQVDEGVWQLLPLLEGDPDLSPRGSMSLTNQYYDLAMLRVPASSRS